MTTPHTTTSPPGADAAARIRRTGSAASRFRTRMRHHDERVEQLAAERAEAERAAAARTTRG